MKARRGSTSAWPRISTASAKKSSRWTHSASRRADGMRPLTPSRKGRGRRSSQQSRIQGTHRLSADGTGDLWCPAGRGAGAGDRADRSRSSLRAGQRHARAAPARTSLALTWWPLPTTPARPRRRAHYSGGWRVGDRCHEDGGPVPGNDASGPAQLDAYRRRSCRGKDLFSQCAAAVRRHLDPRAALRDVGVRPEQLARIAEWSMHDRWARSTGRPMCARCSTLSGSAQSEVRSLSSFISSSRRNGFRKIETFGLSWNLATPSARRR